MKYVFDLPMVLAAGWLLTGCAQNTQKPMTCQQQNKYPMLGRLAKRNNHTLQEVVSGTEAIYEEEKVLSVWRADSGGHGEPQL